MCPWSLALQTCRHARVQTHWHPQTHLHTQSCVHTDTHTHVQTCPKTCASHTCARLHTRAVVDAAAGQREEPRAAAGSGSWGFTGVFQRGLGLGAGRAMPPNGTLFLASARALLPGVESAGKVKSTGRRTRTPVPQSVQMWWQQFLWSGPDQNRNEHLETKPMLNLRKSPCSHILTARRDAKETGCVGGPPGHQHRRDACHRLTEGPLEATLETARSRAPTLAARLLAPHPGLRRLPAVGARWGLGTDGSTDRSAATKVGGRPRGGPVRQPPERHGPKSPSEGTETPDMPQPLPPPQGLAPRKGR